MVKNLLQNKVGECKEQELDKWWPASNGATPSSCFSLGM